MTSQKPLAAWRRDYTSSGLTEADLGPDPVVAFTRWLVEAQESGLHEPNAMVVATSVEGAASSRLVLLKTVDERGFVFYTNYRSRKARELAANPACALLFPWHPVARQVRVEGTAERVDAAESDAYFASRPRDSQIAAWSSPQSERIDRRRLDTSFEEHTQRFAGQDPVPRPPHWGGILVRPRTIEFWQGRPGRMHDRLLFSRLDTATWLVERLAP